jgi:hypothetical protein
LLAEGSSLPVNVDGGCFRGRHRSLVLSVRNRYGVAGALTR